MVEKSGALFENVFGEDVFLFGSRVQCRSFRKNVLKRTFLRFAVESSGALFDERSREEWRVFGKRLFRKKDVF